MPRTKTTSIEDRHLTITDKNDLASCLQQMLLQSGAGPNPELSRGVSDAIMLSSSGNIGGDIGVIWRWVDVLDCGIRTNQVLQLTVSYTQIL